MVVKHSYRSCDAPPGKAWEILIEWGPRGRFNGDVCFFLALLELKAEICLNNWC